MGHSKPVVYAFIDAANLWAVQKSKGRMFDFEKLKVFLKKEFSASQIKIFYYTAYPKEGTRDYSLDGKHKFFTYLKKGLGIVVRKKELKRIVIKGEEGDSIDEKGNMDVEMAIDVVHNIGRYDVGILFSGDSDFLSLINYMRNGGKKVYVYSSENNISRELRTGADGYRDLLLLADDIWGRDLGHRQ